jgi:hypothetical protein
VIAPTAGQLAEAVAISEAAARAMIAQGGDEARAVEFGADQALAWLRVVADPEAVDCAWQDSDDPELRGRWQRYADGWAS